MSQIHVLGKHGDITGYVRIGILAYAALIRVDVEQPGTACRVHWIWFIAWHSPRL